MTESDDLRNTLVVIPRYGMGHADEDLMLRLLGTWLRLTLENGPLPGAVALYSDGVRLATGDSPVVDQLKALETRGSHVILCKTCIDHFGLADDIAVGVIGGMGDILAAQTVAAKVITL